MDKRLEQLAHFKTHPEKGLEFRRFAQSLSGCNLLLQKGKCYRAFVEVCGVYSNSLDLEVRNKFTFNRYRINLTKARILAIYDR